MTDDALQKAFTARAREQDALVFSVIRNPAAVVVIAVAMTIVIAGYWNDTSGFGQAVMTIGVIAFTAVNTAALIAFRRFGSDSLWHNLIDHIEAVVLGVASVAGARYITNAHVVVVIGVAVFALHSSMSPIRRRFYQAFFIAVPLACAWALHLRHAPTRDIAIVLASGLGFFAIHLAIQGYIIRHTRYVVQRELAACATSEQQERDRIARDLHDTVMAQLFQLQTIAQNPAVGGDREAFAHEVARLTQTASRDVYTSVAKLSSQVPVASKLLALQTECELLCRNFNIPCEFITIANNSERLSADDCEHLRGILLEALRNLLRHADVASIQIAICASTQDVLRVAAQLQPGHRPMPTSSDGLGLGQQSLRERAQALACTITTDFGASASEFRVSRSNAT
jgi:signal transduction histidine kinase